MILKIAFVIGLCLLFWLICYINTGSDKKNMLGFRSYPKDVQELVRMDSALGSKVPKEASIAKLFLSNLLLFTIIFLIVGIILKYTIGFKGFVDAFVYFLILGEAMNLFDLVVIDLIWWRNTPRIRFSSLPDKRLYQNPNVHIASFLRGIVMYGISALLVAELLNILP